MDKSAKYILMCEKAREIQRQWVQHHGDVFVTDTGKIVYWISEIHKLQRVKSGFVIDTKDEVIYLSKVTWLPRQDQLIEMAQEVGRRYGSVLQDFFNWADTPYEKNAEPAKKIFPSMEQIWIAFVMQKNYGKKWKGSGWVNFQ
ncbi:MAG: hypothetical protein JRF27_06525 [Deltaproteobacteria bacterium]|nr:hypothetical protein [Deltaproteobacteria bacterium]